MDSKINVIHPVYAKKIGLLIYVGAQKIGGSALAIFGIVIAAFLINNKDGKGRFFEKTFLLANISLDVIFGMLFLILNNTNIRFLEQQLL